MNDGKMSRSEAGKLGWKKSRAKIEERMRKTHEDYEANPKKCSCGANIPFEKKRNDFCSHSCAASVRNIGVNRRIPIEEHPCANCGKKTKNPKFCSMSCGVECAWKKTVAEIDRTGVAVYSPRIVKRYLVQKRGHRCEVCLGMEWRGNKMPLVLDHTDGNAENNDTTNLRLVCGNCNMELPTFSGRNRGNGRAWRRERRHAGKNA